MDRETAVIIMAKQPQVGRSKTRLCPPLSPAESAALAEALLRDTIALVAGLAEVDLAVAVTPVGAVDYFAQITPPGALLLPVEGPDIGACLAQVLAQLLARGYRKALALNADGPSLPPEYLRQVIHLLDEQDVALGPSADGGYYVIGLKAFHPALFEQITWSTSSVLAQTLRQAKSMGLRAGLAAEWYDVDDAAALARLTAELQHLPADRLVHTRRFLNKFNGKGRVA